MDQTKCAYNHENETCLHDPYHRVHIQCVIFTSWWYVLAFAVAEIVVYLITLLIIRVMNRTRSNPIRSEFSWRHPRRHISLNLTELRVTANMEPGPC